MSRLSSERIGSAVRDRYLDCLDFFSGRPFARDYRLVRPYTPCGNARLSALHKAVSQTIAAGIPGDVVECGTARGGSAALMGLALKRSGAGRKLWVFDTFEGLPAPQAGGPDWEDGERYTGSCRGSLEEVKQLFDQCGILPFSRLVKGMFADTLPRSGVGAVSVLHIDCDWYESVKACLDAFYPRVSPGGIIQVDDYGHWKGAREAVDELLKERSQEVSVRSIDYTGRQLLKKR